MRGEEKDLELDLIFPLSQGKRRDRMKEAYVCILLASDLLSPLSSRGSEERTLNSCLNLGLFNDGKDCHKQIEREESVVSSYAKASQSKMGSILSRREREREREDPLPAILLLCVSRTFNGRRKNDVTQSV